MPRGGFHALVVPLMAERNPFRFLLIGIVIGFVLGVVLLIVVAQEEAGEEVEPSKPTAETNPVQGG